MTISFFKKYDPLFSSRNLKALIDIYIPNIKKKNININLNCKHLSHMARLLTFSPMAGVLPAPEQDFEEDLYTVNAN